MASIEVSSQALERIASALIELGHGLRDLAREEPGDRGRPDEAVERLWNRLGLDTQKFLYELAVDFSPRQGPFELPRVAEGLGMTPETARARLMTVGRSLRALGAGAPQLWSSERDPETRRRRYTWDEAAHAAILRLVEG
jgi:hypothetical protein